MQLRYRLLAASAAVCALVGGASAAQAQARPAGGSTLEELVVTAQKREEALQDVPIAVSAFSQQTLERSRITGGPNLILVVPNVNFAKGNFTGYNFQIRGIGAKLIAATGDPGIAVHLNNAPLIANNLFETEFYDVERVEVLRGPQGTLYGRNATGGVINVITNKPSDHFEAFGRVEYGNFNTVRLQAMGNLPLGDEFAFRAAGYFLNQDGFGTNSVTGNDVDDRNLWGVRTTLSFNPAPNFRSYILWDHFSEKDHRNRIGKQLCSKDTGPTSIGGAPFSGVPLVAQIEQGLFTQGCRNTSPYAPDIFGSINSLSTLGGLYGMLSGTQTGDGFAGRVQDPNPYNIQSFFDPSYSAKTDVYELNVDFNVTQDLLLSLVSAYSSSSVNSREDYFRYLPTSTFNTVPNPVNFFAPLVGGQAAYTAIYQALFPGGVIDDPQLGASNMFRTADISSAKSTAWSHELRLQSSFKGPFNFNFGGLLMKFRADFDYFVFFNTGTGFYQLQNVLNMQAPNCFAPAPCVAIDPNPTPTRLGHNYYDNFTPYSLGSGAVFGEAYWQMTDNFKWTAGLRWTDDRKTVLNFQVPLGVPGVGLIPQGSSTVEFKKLTGRFGFDWKPKLDYTDETLIYAFYSRGYKAGGLNPQCSAAPGVICPPPTFAPEFVDAVEVGTKNTLLNNTMTLNLTGFFYNYQGYQIAKIVNRNALNENINAEVWGIELESVWQPIQNLRFNTAIGWLQTNITGGDSIDTLNRVQGAPNLIQVKSAAASNCVTTLAAAQTALAVANSTNNPFALLGLCTATSLAGAGTLIDGTRAVSVGTNAFGGPVSDGVPVLLEGKELPNSPQWTISFGAQYTWQLPGMWSAILRGDFYWQASSFARIYNSVADKLNSWHNLNATLTFTNPDWQVEAGLFVKNATDEQAIQDFYLTDDTSGLFRNSFFTEPRTFGFFVQKRF